MSNFVVYLIYFGCILHPVSVYLVENPFRPYELHYGQISDEERQHLAEEAKKMFYFGYENYLEHAFPKDELDPIHCTGRGPDYENP